MRTCIRKILAAAAVFSMSLAGITGCTSPFSRNSDSDTAVSTISNISALKDGAYYIEHDGMYQELYAKNANYEIASVNPNSASAKRTLWYNDDWDKVPTLYKGDKLVYKTSGTLKETFTIERFEYVGYTVGITGLKKTDSGRYSFSTNEKNMNINPAAADAMKLYDLTTSTAIIDKIGGSYLREGNVSSGGCILGLEKDASYQAEVYAGTYLHTYTLKADSLALTSMELYKTVDYSFLESELLEIHIPESFNSGYYLIGSYGLVRYVNGDSYDGSTDFNIPNPDSSKTTVSSVTTARTSASSATTQTGSTQTAPAGETQELIPITPTETQSAQ